MTHKAIGEVRVKPLRLEGFAADLNAAMARTGATVRGLADELGINKSAISRVRTGKQVTQSNFIALFNWLAVLDRSPTVVEEEVATFDGNELWEILFNATKGGALECLTDAEMADAATAIRARFASPSKPEQGALASNEVADGDTQTGLGSTDETQAPSPVPQAVAWPIDTDDQVELLSKECGINNRRFMTPKDYSIYCEQQRQFVRLASIPLSGGDTEKVEVTDADVGIALEVWDSLGGYSKIERMRAALSTLEGKLRTLEGKRT